MPFSVTITGPRLPVPATHTISQESAFVVGRGRKNDFVANHPLVSRYHARFDTTPSGIQVVDLNSAAGTVVNGEAIPAEHAVPLNPGDVVDIGPYRFVLTLIADGQPANHSVTAGRASFPALRNRYKPVTDAPYKPALGLPLAHSESIRLLPDIFHTDFMRRFLMLIESIHLPIRWNMDNFDLYLDPRSTPRDFIPWLASWFDLTF
ncbi:MAG: FHA domain-containing protein, partial [Candidatus Promineifilaceae bacterium]